MKYPTPSEYQEALQFPETALADPELRAGTPETNALGLPQAVTGAFAAVFPISTRTGRWAAKCFLSGTRDQQKRYRAIAEHLRAAELLHVVAFDYQPEGVQVRGQSWPLLKMEWARGVPLGRFVDQHIDAPEVLADLAERWAAMLRDLEAAGVAHGDLQHGNVFVQERSGENSGSALALRLVDYDTMFVPALRGLGSPEVGHRNYQHPDRDEGDFGPHLDRFAGLVVFTALHACIHRPALWARFNTGENLLFRAADFYDPSASVLFEELKEIEEVRPLVEALRTACYLEPEAVPALEDVRADRAGAADASARQAAQARRRRERRRAEGRPRGVFARWFLPAAVALVAAVVAAAALGSMWIAALALLIGAGVLGGGSVRGYRRVPLVRRRRRLGQEADHVSQIIENLERQIESLHAQRTGAKDAVEERHARRLRELQEKALYDQLKYHFIGEVRAVEGITHKVVVRLKASGIRTAYQATTERLRPIRQMSDQSKTRIAMWRASLVREYEDAIPEQLSPAEERRIERYAEQRAEHLRREIARAEDKIAVQEEERAQITERRAALPALSFGRYLRFLLRLDTLPPMEPAPSAPAPAPPPGEANSPATAPDAGRSEGPWWAQRS